MVRRDSHAGQCYGRERDGVGVAHPAQRDAQARSSVLTGSSQGTARRSVSTPNSGWATEDSTEAASTTPDGRVAVGALGDEEGHEGGDGTLVDVDAGVSDGQPGDRVVFSHLRILRGAARVPLPIICQVMTEVRHTPVAPTRAQHLGTGGEIDAHRHDDHQIVYAGRGVVSVTTDSVALGRPGDACPLGPGRHRPRPPGARRPRAAPGGAARARIRCGWTVPPCSR